MIMARMGVCLYPCLCYCDVFNEDKENRTMSDIKRFYHGTDSDSAKSIYNSQKVNVGIGSKSVDFGPGFYMTDSEEQAINWAKRKAALRKKKPAVVTILFDVGNATPYIQSFSDDLRWGQFVINSRNGYNYINKIPLKEHNLDARYEITYGRIADRKVTEISPMLDKEGKLLDDVKYLFEEKYSMQIALHTEFATTFIRKITYRTL